MTEVRLINRTDTAANWTAQNPTPYEGEICTEHDTGKFKIGDGTTAWTSLAYSADTPGGLATHIADTTAAHAASAISFSAVGTIAATDAQTAIAEVATDAASALSTHEADTTSVHGISNTASLLTTVAVPSNITATGTPSGSTFLRGDGAWATPSSGSVATDAVFDAKGDLVVGTAADTAARLAVGTAGQILVPNSNASTGLQWAALPVTPIIPAVNDYYLGWGRTGNSSDARGANTGHLMFTPHWVPIRMGVDRIAFRNNSTSGTSVYRVGLYTAGTDGKPSTLIVDAGTVAAGGAAGDKEVTISQTLDPGLYYIGCAAQTADGNVRRAALVNYWVPNSTLSSAVSYSLANQWYYQASVTGALPSTATPVWGVGNDECPLLLLRRSS